MRQSLITRHFVLLVVFACMIAVGATTSSQDLQYPDDIYWDNTISPSLLGVNGTISAAIVWNGSLIVAGNFSVAGGIMAHNIAAWNGTTWSALNEGLNGEVYALAIYNGKLVASGEFHISGNTPLTHIAMWDGSFWSNVGFGLVTPATVLAVYNGRLVVNNFDNSGNGSIGAWDGTSWAPLDTYYWNCFFDDAEIIRSLTVFDGKLYAAGRFDTADGHAASNIVVWNGTSWSPIGTGFDAQVYALTVYDSFLIAAGEFKTVNGVTAPSIAAWDGSSWSSLGSNMAPWYPKLLTTYNGSLAAFGYEVGLQTWNGSSWTDQGASNSINLRCLVEYNGQLIGVTNNKLVRWNGGSWQQVESSAPGHVFSISCYQVYNGKLIAGGVFTSTDGESISLIAQWDGTSWSPYDSGPNGYIHAMAIYDNKLVVAGYFDSVAGVAAKYVAAWDGNAWSPVGSGSSDNTSHLLPGRVLQVYGDKLIMGGDADLYAGDSVMVTAWDGSVWTSLGRFRDPDYSEYVSIIHMTVHDNKLIVSGSFLAPDGVNAKNIAAWDGVTWSPLGSGLPNYIGNLVSYEGLLYAEFSDKISRWNGATWSQFAMLKKGWHWGSVSAFGLYNNSLIIGGYFDTINGIAANGIIEWNGHTWKTLGSGIGGVTYPGISTLAEIDGALAVGGNFTIAGGKPAAFAATWYPTPTDVDDDQTGGLPESFALQQNYPNPFNPSTQIHFTVPARSHVTVEVINLLGQSVRRLVDETKPAGTYTITWNGKNNEGNQVATGVYMYRLTAGEFTETKKMVLIK